MYGKALFFVVLVVLGAVLPYLLADDEWLAKVEGWIPPDSTVIEGDVASAFASEPTTTGKPVSVDGSTSTPSTLQMDSVTESVSALSPELSSGGTTGNISQAGQPPSGRNLELPRINGPPGVPIENLLSFGVTPDWISKNWSRVTTRLAELNLQGWRVPVSVEAPSNFVGSITYYFDQQRNLQRILLHGYTADASNFIQLATSRYGMRRIPNTLSELYAASVKGQTIGGLRVDFKPILKSDGQKRCKVLMELNRQQSPFGMSYEFERILKRTEVENRLLTRIRDGSQLFEMERRSQLNSLQPSK